MTATIKNAYKLGRLIEKRNVADWQFTNRAEARKKVIEEEINWIIEESPELKEFIPSSIICFIF